MHQKEYLNKPAQPNFLHAKKALLLNFTASSYHWGCYGTSMDIYQSLLEKNYYVEVITVNATHSISPTAEKISDFDDKVFFDNFCRTNNLLAKSIAQSDVVVSNGEGTLHRLGKGAINLLYLMYISKKFFSKKVHLINFSCFPNGNETSPTDKTLIYQGVLRHLDIITPREKITNRILTESGIHSKQSFDCLPRFLDRHNYLNSHSPKGNILVTGGVFFDDKRYKLFVDFIKHFLRKNVQVTFLLGAHFSPAQEDILLKNRLKEDTDPQKLRIADARSMEQWINEFQSASFLLSARFHHSIAALSIGTPFRYFSSNTPKISAALETIDENNKYFCVDKGNSITLRDAAEEAVFNSATISSEKRAKKMLSFAFNNFKDL